MSTIKVNEVQHTGGTTAQTIDSTGRILTPARPAFSAYMTSNQSNRSTNTNHTVDFNATYFDVGSNFNTSTFKYIVPTTGIYQFNLSLRIDDIDTATDYIRVSLIVTDDAGYGGNKAYRAYRSGNSFAADSAHWGIDMSHLVKANASSEVYVEFFTYDGTAQTDIISNDSYFSGFLVG